MTPQEAIAVLSKLGVLDPQWNSWMVPLDSGDMAVIPAFEVETDPDGAVLKAIGFIETSDVMYGLAPRRLRKPARRTGLPAAPHGKEARNART